LFEWKRCWDIKDIRERMWRRKREIRESGRKRERRRRERGGKRESGCDFEADLTVFGACDTGSK
jgi:hypothetical protein